MSSTWLASYKNNLGRNKPSSKISNANFLIFTKAWDKASRSTLSVEIKILWFNRASFQVAWSVHLSTPSLPISSLDWYRLKYFSNTDLCWRHRATVGERSQTIWKNLNECSLQGQGKQTSSCSAASKAASARATALKADIVRLGCTKWLCDSRKQISDWHCCFPRSSVHLRIISKIKGSKSILENYRHNDILSERGLDHLCLIWTQNIFLAIDAISTVLGHR